MILVDFTFFYAMRVVVPHVNVNMERSSCAGRDSIDAEERGALSAKSATKGDETLSTAQS